MKLEKIFTCVQQALEPYTQLVLNLNNHHMPLQIEELEQIFTPTLSSQISQISKQYARKQSMRSCGNPSFSHPLRSALWAKALKCNEDAILACAYHDFLEDFILELANSEALLKEIPANIQQTSIALTNTHSIFLKKLLEKAKNKNTQELILDIKPFENSPVFGSVAQQLTHFLEDKDTYSLAQLQQKSYGAYLAQLSTYTQQKGDEKALIAKLADRLDNTLADRPSKFQNIIKLYSKNNLLLEACEEIIKDQTPQSQVLYILLYERSTTQLAELIETYEETIKQRGAFYGEQYKQLQQKLKTQQEKFTAYQDLIKELLEGKEIQTFLKKLCQNTSKH